MLQEIKECVGRLVNFETASDDDLYYMSKGHINWLIKRAEEAEKLTRIAIEADEGCEYWKEKFQQAQAKAERYEKALREIANEQEVGEGDFNAADVANNLIATAKEALGDES